MIQKGDTILIRRPTKKNPSRLIQAYVRYVIEQPGKPRRLALVGSNQRKITLREDSPDIASKLDASESDEYGTVNLEKERVDEPFDIT